MEMDDEDAGLCSPGCSERAVSPSPQIDVDGIDDVQALKALLKAREAKLATLEQRVQVAQSAKGKLKERYTEKIEMLEQLVMALRRKLQPKEGGEGADAALQEQLQQRVAQLQKQNDNLREMVSVQKQQLSAAKAAAAKPAPGGDVDVRVLEKMEEKVHELTAALQTRTRECKAQAQQLQHQDMKIAEQETLLANAHKNSPDTAGLVHKLQMINAELKEARSQGAEAQQQRDRMSAEYDALQNTVTQQQLEKDQLQRESEARAKQLHELQKERQRQIMETEEMHRMLCELEDQRNQLQHEADALRVDATRAMDATMNASLGADRESKQVAVLQHETATLRRHLESQQETRDKIVQEHDSTKQELRIAMDRNARLEFDLLTAQNDLTEARAKLESAGDVSEKMQEMRRHASLQVQEMQDVIASTVDKATAKEARLQGDIERLEVNLREVDERRGIAEGLVQEMTQELEQRMDELRSTQDQLAETSQRMAAAHTSNETLKVEANKMRQHCESQQKNIALHDEEMDKRTKDLAKLRASVEQLEMDYSRARAQIEKADLERQQDDAESARLRELLAAAADMNTELEAENERAHKELANAKDANANLLDRVSVLTSQMHEAGEAVQLLAQRDKELLEIKALNQELTKEKTQLTMQVAHLEEVHTQARDEMAKLRGQQDHLLTQQLSDRDTIGELNAQIAELKSRVNALGESQQRLSAEVKTKDEALANLVETRNRLESQASELEAAQHTKASELEDRDRQLAVAHTRILGVETRVRDADAKIVTMTAQLAELTEELKGKTQELADQATFVGSLQSAELERERAREVELQGLHQQYAAKHDKLSLQLQEMTDLVGNRNSVVSALNDEVAGLQREQERLRASVKEEQTRVEATQQLNSELQAQMEQYNEKLTLGQRALDHNRAQNVIMEELRHRIADKDSLLAEKDLQVQELMKQRDDAQNQVFEFRGKGDVTDRQVTALTKAHQDLQEQLVTTIEKEQIRQQHIERLHKKAVQSKDILVRRIISQFLYDALSQAFYGWSSVIMPGTARTGNTDAASIPGSPQMAVSLRHALTRASAPTTAPIGLQAPGSSQPSPTKIGLQAVGAHVFSAPGNVTPDTYDTAPVSVGRPFLNASLPQSPISVGRPNLISKVSSTVESVADRGSENGFPGIGRGNAAHSVEAAASVQSQERPPSKPPLSPQSAARQNVNVNLAGIGSFQQRQANLDSYGRVASAGGTMPTWAQHVKSVSRQGSEPDGIAEIIL